MDTLTWIATHVAAALVGLALGRAWAARMGGGESNPNTAPSWDNAAIDRVAMRLAVFCAGAGGKASRPGVSSSSTPLYGLPQVNPRFQASARYLKSNDRAWHDLGERERIAEELLRADLRIVPLPDTRRSDVFDSGDTDRSNGGGA